MEIYVYFAILSEILLPIDFCCFHIFLLLLPVSDCIFCSNSHNVRMSVFFIITLHYFLWIFHHFFFYFLLNVRLLTLAPTNANATRIILPYQISVDEWNSSWYRMPWRWSLMMTMTKLHRLSFILMLNTQHKKDLSERRMMSRRFYRPPYDDFRSHQYYYDDFISARHHSGYSSDVYGRMYSDRIDGELFDFDFVFVLFLCCCVECCSWLELKLRDVWSGLMTNNFSTFFLSLVMLICYEPHGPRLSSLLSFPVFIRFSDLRVLLSCWSCIAFSSTTALSIQRNPNSWNNRIAFRLCKHQIDIHEYCIAQRDARFYEIFTYTRRTLLILCKGLKSRFSAFHHCVIRIKQHNTSL